MRTCSLAWRLTLAQHLRAGKRAAHRTPIILCFSFCMRARRWGSCGGMTDLVMACAGCMSSSGARQTVTGSNEIQTRQCVLVRKHHLRREVP